jgi:MFS family permease
VSAPTRPPTDAFAARRGLAAVAVAIVAAILPVFLLASLSVEVRADLGYGEATAGLVLAAFFGASALVSARIGRWVDRVGPSRALGTALVVSAAVQLGVGGLARSAAALAVLAGVGGMANATAQLGANVFIARDLPLHRQGIGFAVKQSAMPGASLVAGLALPVIALTLGWRWVFIGGAALALAALVGIRAAVPADVPRPVVPVPAGAGREDPTTDPPLVALVLLALAAAMATGAAVTLGGFFVESAVDAGVEVGVAGLAFAGGSVISILVRLTVGAAADRREGNLLGVVAVMLLLGAAMSAVFTWRTPLLHLVGVPLAFGAGWAWPGLFNLSVVRAAPDRPGRATGITQTGTYVGGAVGPIVFGSVAEAAGYTTAWWLAAALGVAAAGAVVVARSRLRPALRSSAPMTPSTRP